MIQTGCEVIQIRFHVPVFSHPFEMSGGFLERQELHSIWQWLVQDRNFKRVLPDWVIDWVTVEDWHILDDLECSRRLYWSCRLPTVVSNKGFGNTLETR